MNQKEDVEAGVFTSADMPVAMKNIFSRYKDYLLTEEQYNDLVLTSIGQIESALSKSWKAKQKAGDMEGLIMSRWTLQGPALFQSPLFFDTPQSRGEQG